MTNKLTGREALAYMATGGWFSVGDEGSYAHRVPEDDDVKYFFCDKLHTAKIYMDQMIRDGITPCPDPTVKVDEYEHRRKGLLLMLEQHMGKLSRDVADHILDFVQDEFQRKEGKP